MSFGPKSPRRGNQHQHQFHNLLAMMSPFNQAKLKKTVGADFKKLLIFQFRYWRAEGRVDIEERNRKERWRIVYSRFPMISTADDRFFGY